MGFFQSFINDANRNRQGFRQAEPAAHAFAVEDPPGLIPTDTASTPDEFAPPPRSEVSASGVQQNALPDVSHDVAVPSVMKHGVASEQSAETAVGTPDTFATPPRSEVSASGVQQNALPDVSHDVAVPPVMKHGVASEQPAETVGTPDAFATPPRSEVSASGVQQNALPDIKIKVATAPAGLKPAGQVASKHPAESVLQKATVDIAAQGSQPAISAEPNQPIEPRPALASKHPAELDLQKATVAAAQGQQPAISAESGRQALPRPTAGTAIADKARNRSVVQQKANEPVRSESPDSTVAVNPHKQPDAFGAAQPPLPKTAITTASIQQAKQALGLFSPFADAPEKSSPTRDESAPHVQIGTIEVIVESAAVVQRSSSQNTGFTRNPGRYYQRRL